MRSTLAIAALLLLSAQSADDVQKALKREADSLATWTTNKTLLDALRAQNAKNTSAADIERLDEDWQRGGAAAAVKQVTSGPCADQLRALAAKDARYGETFLVDMRGALVCATHRTSDYYQGDEPKWSRPFQEGKAFIDRPRLDDSSQSRLAQISLPVVDGGKTVGVLTVGIHIDRLTK